MTSQILDAPMPPIHLVQRVISRDVEEPTGHFDTEGAGARRFFAELLGSEWFFDGKRVLDFGCGPGKILRHFLPEAVDGVYYGCDIDAESIQWLDRNLSPPLHVFVNEEAPPLPLPDGHLDLIWCSSVFTHITDHWSAWLLELHRVLAPRGILIASFMGTSMARKVAGVPLPADEIGMTVLQYGETFEGLKQGPMVLHSSWWIRAHWGRAFDVLELREGPEGRQGVVVMRKRPSQLSTADLERVEPDEPRELTAMRAQIGHLFREVAGLRARC